jgi:muconate cycloisomerase
MALYDIVGKALNTPAYNLLGGLFRERIPLSTSLPIVEPEAAVKEAEELVGRGQRIIKLKTGHEFMEQPVKAWDLDGLAEVRRATSTYIMADESANSPRDVLELVRRRAVDLISVYIVSPGGLLNAKKMCLVAEPAGVGCYVGGALDGAISGRAGLHLAASTPNISWGCELGGIFLLEEDLGTEPLTLENGELLVPHGPGLGGDLDREKVKRYQIECYQVQP